MLVRFSSIKTESITMFGDIAVNLIKILGASGNLPGAIGAADIPAAIERLQQQLQSPSAQIIEPASSERILDESDNEPPVALSTRAGPLLDLLKRAAAEKVPVMWEKI